MTHSAQIRPLAGVPDHGFGYLGRLAHSVLAEYTGSILLVPHLHHGHNTLPDPPFPLAAQAPVGDLSEGFLECGEDLVKFLREGARAIRNQPKPDISAFDRQARILQRALRFDSIAMAWNDPGHAGFSVVAAVDRAGNALAGQLPAKGSAVDIELVDLAPYADDPIIMLLRDVLLAQYEWTCDVFGIVP